MIEQVKQLVSQSAQIPLLSTLGAGQRDTQVKTPSSSFSEASAEHDVQFSIFPSHSAQTSLHGSHSLVTSLAIVMLAGQGFMHSV